LLFWLLHWWCCGRGQWRCRGSWTAAPSSGETRLFTPLVFRFAFSSFVVKRPPFLHSLFIFLCNSLPCFKLLRVLSFLSLSRLLSFYSYLCFLLSSSFVGVECGIYWAKERGGVPIATLCCAWGVGPSYPTTTPDEVANWCGSHGATSLVSHYEGACVLTEHAGRERGRQN